MADQELRVRILAEDKATKTLTEVEDSVESIEKHDELVIEVKAPDAKTSATNLKELGDQLERAADRARALGAQTVSVRFVGQDADEFIRNLGEADAAIERIDGQTVSVKMDVDKVGAFSSGLQSAGTELDKIEKSSIGSVGALRDVGGAFGNLGGNALDASEGLLGAGEALATLGIVSEGTAEKVAAVGFAVGGALLGMNLLANALGSITGSADAAQVSFDKLVTTIESGVDPVAQFSQVSKDLASDWSDLGTLTEQGGFGRAFNAFMLNLVGIDTEVPPATKAIDAFNKVLEKSPALARELLPHLIAAQKQLGLSADQVKKLNDGLGDTVEASVQAGQGAKKLEADTKLLNQAIELGVDIKRADGEAYDAWITRITNATAAVLNQIPAADASSAALFRMKEATDATSDSAAQAAANFTALVSVPDNAAALVKFFDTLNSQWDRGAISAEAFGKAFTAAFSQKFNIHDAFVESSKAVDQFGEDIKDMSLKGANALGHLTSFGEDGQKIFEALAKLGPKLGDDLSESLVKSGGDFDAVRQRAAELRDEVQKKLVSAGVDPSEIDNYFQQLLIDPPTIEATLKITAEQRKQDIAKQLLGAYQDEIDKNPALKAIIQGKVVNEDWTGVITEILGILNDPANPLTAAVLSKLDPATAKQVEDQLNKIARDRTATINAEIHASLDGRPLELPPGVDLTTGRSVPSSTVVVNQHITSGFGTDRFALQRAIRRGNRDLNRLAGVRP